MEYVLGPAVREQNGGALVRLADPDKLDSFSWVKNAY
jgi:hypothetical protein